MPLVLITGASTGIGRSTALRLAADGWTVLAGFRDEQAGRELAEQARPAGSVVALALDVTDPDQVERAAQTVDEQAARAGVSTAGGLDALVNNAGIGVAGPLELVSDEDMRRQFDVNVLAQLAVTRALLPALRRARGRIVFMSSIGGRVTMPYSAPYAASKHAIEAFGDALRIELRSSGVQVALVEPGSIATPIWDKAVADAERVTIPPRLSAEYGHVPAALAKAMSGAGKRGLPPEAVADTIAGALSSGRMRSRYVVGRDARAMLAIRRLLPDRVWDRVAQRAMGV